MKKKCLILNNRERIPEHVLDDFTSRLDVVWCQDIDRKENLTQVLRQHKDSHVLITTYMDLCRENLSILSGLEAIITTTTAFEYIDFDYCVEKNILVMNSSDYTGSSVAEHAIALMFGCARKLTLLDRRIRRKDFQCFDCMGMELSGKCAGILGMGHIGSVIAKMTSGIGMETIFFNRSKKGVRGCRQVDIPSLFNVSDVIFITLPLRQETEGLIDQKAFAAMKQSAILVSISPDRIIDFDALRYALEHQEIAGVGLDILEENSKYFELPNAIITPRRAWYTAECFERRIMTWKETLAAFLDNQPINLVSRSN